MNSVASFADRYPISIVSAPVHRMTRALAFSSLVTALRSLRDRLELEWEQPETGYSEVADYVIASGTHVPADFLRELAVTLDTECPEAVDRELAEILSEAATASVEDSIPSIITE